MSYRSTMDYHDARRARAYALLKKHNLSVPMSELSIDSDLQQSAILEMLDKLLSALTSPERGDGK